MRLFLLLAIALIYPPWLAISAIGASEDDWYGKEVQENWKKEIFKAKAQLRATAQNDRALADVKTVTCVLLEAIVMYAKGHEPKEGEETEDWRCEFKDEGNVIRSIEGVPAKFFKENRKKIKSGHTVLKITYPSDGSDSDTITNPDVLTIPAGAKIEIHDIADEDEEGYRHHHRRTAVDALGNHTLLVFRVTDSNGVGPDSTAVELSDNIFGTGTDLHNLVSCCQQVSRNSCQVYHPSFASQQLGLKLSGL